MYKQVYDPVGGSLGLSTLFAVLPLVTLFALLELYKAGEARWEQEVPFGPITVQGGRE